MALQIIQNQTEHELLVSVISKSNISADAKETWFEIVDKMDTDSCNAILIALHEGGEGSIEYLTENMLEKIDLAQNDFDAFVRMVNDELQGK